MLKLFQDLKGKVSSKLIRKGAFANQHFDQSGNFIFREIDKITEREKTTVLTNINPSRDLMGDLSGRGSEKMADSQTKKVAQFKDILEKCFPIDPTKRITLNQALMHPFIQEKMD